MGQPIPWTGMMSIYHKITPNKCLCLPPAPQAQALHGQEVRSLLLLLWQVTLQRLPGEEALCWWSLGMWPRLGEVTLAQVWGEYVKTKRVISCHFLGGDIFLSEIQH